MGRPMTPGWRAVERLCRLLEPDERDAVCGDLTESHVSASHALCEVAGLVLRRQAELWLDWRPWFVLAAVVVPFGFLLSVSSRSFAATATSDLWLYIRTGDWAYFANPGWRHDVIDAAVYSTVSLAALAGWSWTAGFVLGRLSRRAVWTIAFLFFLVVVFGTLGSTTTFRLAPVATMLLRALLVMLPAWHGVRRGLIPAAPRPWPTFIVTATMIAATAFVSKGLEGSLTFGYGLMRPLPGPDGVIGSLDDPRPLWWTSLVMLWPAAFVAMTVVTSRLPRRAG